MAPLAAISLLAAAAAVAINPVLINVSLTGRKKRSTDDWNPEIKEKMHELQVNFHCLRKKNRNFLCVFLCVPFSLSQVLERFLGTIPENNRYQQQILSMYLSCSGYTEPNNQCLDRVVCDYSDDKSAINTEEKDVISM